MTISVRKLAAMERAKALGLEIKKPEISDLERHALQWKRCEEEKTEVQSPKCKVQEVIAEKQDPVSLAESAAGRARAGKHRASGIHHPRPSPSQGGPASSNSKNVRTDEGFDWQAHRPEQGEPEKKVKNLNSASIWRLARKMMAREWAMALGSGGFEGEQPDIERKAAEHRQKKLAERERKEFEQQRANKQRTILEEALQSFGRNLLKVPIRAAPDSAETLLKEALAEVGDTIRITWQPDACHISLEPWEERRLRKKTGDTVPAVFQATIDDNFSLTRYQRVKNPDVLKQTQNDIILKEILLNFRKSPGKDSHAFENAVAEGGRIIQSTKMDGGWKIKFEPWEETRRRNLERRGRPPIVTYVIKADKDFKHVSCERI